MRKSKPGDSSALPEVLDSECEALAQECVGCQGGDSPVTAGEGMQGILSEQRTQRPQRMSSTPPPHPSIPAGAL